MMFGNLKIARLLLLVSAVSIGAAAQEICPPRPAPGSVVQDPLDLYSQNGTLTLNLSLKSEIGPTGFTHYCYVYLSNGQPVEAPTLRVNPGDRLVMNFTNNITAIGMAHKSRHAKMRPMEMGDMKNAKASGDPCLGGMVMDSSTNIHWHGMNIPPDCHQDEVIKTVIPNDGTPFQYSFQVPANDPPGLYWYHPHAHGFSAPQVYGGAAGALIIEGSNPLTDGLPERVLTIRNNVDAVSDEDGQFTLNFQPINYPHTELPVINMTAGQKEYWRVLNSSTNGFLTLQVIQNGAVPLQVISLDGIPLQTPTNMTTIQVPPAGRVEFVTPALQANLPAVLYTTGYNTGSIGDEMPPAKLANLVVTTGAGGSHNLPKTHGPNLSTQAKRFSGLAGLKPTTTRSLYFSELNVGTNGPGQFFITVDGQQQRVFDPKYPPAITTNVGAVEDWTISNQTAEAHAFHIHQIHFLVTAENGIPDPNGALVDTVTVPAWTGTGPYPSVTVRMDFRDPNIAGTFVYHCHILDHEDGGMMATIVVKPN